MNITHDQEDTREKTIKEPKKYDSTLIAAYIKKHWGELANYDKLEKTVYLCDNSILGQPAFIELLKKYKMFIQPSLF